MTFFANSVTVLVAAVLLNLAFTFISPPLQGLVAPFNTQSDGDTMGSKVILYGHPLSTCTRRVAVVLKEKNIPYELKMVDLSKGEHKDPEYIANLQPFGQVPVLVDGDIQLYESRAIGRYIAMKYASEGTPLIPLPSDFAALAKFEEAASVEVSNFDPYTSGIAVEKVFKPMRGLTTDEARVDYYATTFKQKLLAYEQILSKRKYMAGDELTVVDLFHLPYGTMYEKQGYDSLTSGEFPSVARWWKEISSLSSWESVKDGA